LFKEFSRAYDNCVERGKNELKRLLSFFLSFFLFLKFAFVFFLLFQFQNVKGSFLLEDTPKNADNIERTILVCVFFGYFANSVVIFLSFGLMPEKLSSRAVVIVYWLIYISS